MRRSIISLITLLFVLLIVGMVARATGASPTEVAAKPVTQTVYSVPVAGSIARNDKITGGGTPTDTPTAVAPTDTAVTETPTASVDTETPTAPVDTETPGTATEVTETATSTAEASETSTPTASEADTATATATLPTATPTCVPGAGSWRAGLDLPSVLARAVGVYFPADGNFYVMGGRSTDAAGSDQLNPLELTTNTGTWSTRNATYDDNQVNNQACGVLTQSGTPYIFCVGGSAAGATTASSEVRRYNPITDTLIGLGATDAWPGNFSGSVLPGGFAVANNKLYILGGFDINTAATNKIWEFDPNAAVGSRWVQKVNAPSIMMYAPAASIGGTIYVGGASDFQDGAVVDTNLSFSFDPIANTIGTIATIPRATGETRAVTVNNQMWVLGGGRVNPNPSNEVNIYDPTTDAWSQGPSFATPRRNAAADIDPATNRIWLAGGYDHTGTTLTSSLEIFTPDSSCPPQPTSTAGPTETPGGPTRTATNTGTSTVTPTGTATACAIVFEDVPIGSTFYYYVKCLACSGIINGYPCGNSPAEPCNSNNDPYFRPFINITRGQFAKIASNAAGFEEPPRGAQQYVDVPLDSTFYPYIWRLVDRGIATGYPCGGPGTPCNQTDDPYFLPGALITRGQLAKINSNTAGYEEQAPTQQYEDIPLGSTFHDFIWRLTDRGIITGYPCGGAGEPCDSNNMPYFRPGANATRGQASKFITNTFFPDCPILRK